MQEQSLRDEGKVVVVGIAATNRAEEGVNGVTLVGFCSDITS
jgi:hypothetical protein